MGKKMMVCAAVVGSMATLAYFYMKQNPDIMCEVRRSAKDLAKKTYVTLEEME